MKITFLGTNGWFSTQTGKTICTLVESEKHYIIFDAGDGIQNLDKYTKRQKPIYLFLSHLHLDHVFGLHILSKYEFKNRITLCCPKGLKQDFDKIAGHPFIMPLKDFFPNYGTKVLSSLANNLPFPVEIRKLNHVDPTWGYRITLENITVTYCCDTGKSQNVLRLAKNCDVLIHECANSPGFADRGWGHTNPQEAAQVAKKAVAQKLYLTHFSPVAYPAMKNRMVAQKTARKIFKQAFAARDGMTINI